MTGDVGDFVLEQLRHIRSSIDRIDMWLGDLASVRMDRIGSRLARIEKRLDLVEA